MKKPAAKNAAGLPPYSFRLLVVLALIAFAFFSVLLIVLERME